MYESFLTLDAGSDRFLKLCKWTEGNVLLEQDLTVSARISESSLRIVYPLRRAVEFGEDCRRDMW